MDKKQLLILLEREPDNASLLTEYAKILYSEGETSQANMYFLLALQKEPTNSITNLEYAVFLYDSGKVNEASNFFKTAKNNLDINNLIVLFYLIDILWLKDQYQLCFETLILFKKRTLNKEEIKQLELVYDSLIIDFDIDLAESPFQIVILILIANLLRKKKEGAIYQKILGKKFDSSSLISLGIRDYL